jgi:hypothetical protein
MGIAYIIISSLTIIIAPIVAVAIGQILQNNSLKRKDKIDIFKTLVIYNVYDWGSSHRAVDALNSIPIIFADNKTVVDKYFAYFESCRINGTNDSHCKAIETARIKLLEEMSRTLGYKNEWDVFRNTYLPSGLHDEMVKNQKYKDAQLLVAEMVKNIPPEMLLTNFVQKSKEVS